MRRSNHRCLWIIIHNPKVVSVTGPDRGIDVMKPLHWRSVNRKGSGRPTHVALHGDWWNETKWIRWMWRNDEMKFGRGKREKPREKPTQTPFRPPQNPHGVTERTRDPSGGMRATNRLRHEVTLNNRVKWCEPNELPYERWCKWFRYIFV